MKLGTKGRKEQIVTEGMLAKHVGSGTVSVFATPMMIAGLEGTAEESVRDGLETGKTTVGTRMDCTHLAPTPAGMKVWFETELVEIDGKLLTFRVQAFDECGLIGEGTHQRAIVTKERFEARAKEKLSRG